MNFLKRKNAGAGIGADKCPALGNFQNLLPPLWLVEPSSAGGLKVPQ